MTSQLTLLLENCPGALLRVLGLAERSGYSLVSVQARQTDQGTILLNLYVQTTRPIVMLERQFNKLFDVHSVEVM